MCSRADDPTTYDEAPECAHCRTYHYGDACDPVALADAMDDDEQAEMDRRINERIDEMKLEANR